MAARMSRRVVFHKPQLLNLRILSATSRKLTREEQDKINKTRKSVGIFASPLLTCLLTPVALAHALYVCDCVPCSPESLLGQTGGQERWSF